MSVDPVVPGWLIATALALALGGCVVAARRSRRPRRWLNRALLAALLAAMAARPGAAPTGGEALLTDLDVYFVVDRTSSIVAEDYAGTAPRLDGVRSDLAVLAGQLPGARFAVIGFDNEVVDLMPLTDDIAALDTTLRLLAPEVTTYSTGSSPRLPAAVVAAHLQQLERDDPDRRRVVVFVSDGETTADEPGRDSFTEVAAVIDGGVVLGYGTAQGGPMRERSGVDPRVDATAAAYIVDPATDEPAISRIDEAELRAIAAELGVDYVHRGGPGGTAAIAADLRRASAERESGERRPASADRTWLVAYPVLATALVEVAIVAGDLSRTTASASSGRTAPLGRRLGARR